MKINPPQMMLFLLPKPMIKINKMKNTRIVIKIKLWAMIKGELRKMKMRMIKKSQYPQLLGLRRCTNTFAANSDLQHHVPDFYHGACGQRMANALLDGLLAGRLLHCHACSKPGGGGRSVLSQDTPCQRGPPERQVDSQHLRCAIDPSFMPIRVHMVASLRCHASTADPDKFVWTWSANQQYSTSYIAFFLVQSSVPASKELQRTRTPPSCKFFVWLALLERCWTSERLQCHNMQNSEPCALCSQAPEGIHHLLLGCVYSREVWFRSMRHPGLHHLTPTSECRPDDWWLQSR
jgi:hypothetical protein